jgi:predicted amino acid-binding ACT domain protein
MAAISGFCNQRYPDGEKSYSEKRQLLADGPNHVANVNAVLNERGIDIGWIELTLIEAQISMNIELGTPLDAAFEQRISESFYNSYIKDIHLALIVEPGADDDQLAQIREKAANNRLGAGLHGFFSTAKTSIINSVDAISLDEEQVALTAEEFSQKKEAYLVLIEKALEYASQFEDPQEYCAAFKEKLMSDMAEQSKNALDIKL